MSDRFFGDPPTDEERAKMDRRMRGLYRKFRVERTDGRSVEGEKHHGCAYFVLDMTHDPFAVPAIAAYAEACRREYPVLSADLHKWVLAQPTEGGSDE